MEVLKDQGSTSVLVVLNQSAPYRAPMCSLWAGTVNFIYFRLSSYLVHLSHLRTIISINESVYERELKTDLETRRISFYDCPSRRIRMMWVLFASFFSFQFKLLPEILTDLPYLPSQGRGWLAFPAMASLITEVKWDTVTDRRVS